MGRKTVSRISCIRRLGRLEHERPPSIFLKRHRRRSRRAAGHALRSLVGSTPKRTFELLANPAEPLFEGDAVGADGTLLGG